MSELTLRERKKLAAMRRLQDVALDLFDEHGYDAVTIEQIAAAAEVSPSSVYRYFGTKEQLVLWDEYDPQIMDYLDEALREHPPVAAIRRAMARALEQVFGREEARVRRRVRRIFSEPALLAKTMEQTDVMVSWFGAMLAVHTGRDQDDLDVQVVAHAVTWSMVAVLRQWHASGFAEPLADGLDRAFELLEAGLALDAQEPAVRGSR